MKPTILVVEDDADIRELVAKYLSSNELKVRVATNSSDMDACLAKERIHLIVLDLMLPGEDGLTICRRLRAISQIPILMLTALKDDIDRILGLEMGADDYLTKPFNPRELLARIRAILRRHGGAEQTLAATSSQTPTFRFSGWSLDTKLRRLHDRNEARIILTGAEFELLRVFCERPGTVLSRDSLIELTQGREAHGSERSIDILISRLRQKIELNPKDPVLFHTIRSGGYLFSPEVTTE